MRNIKTTVAFTGYRTEKMPFTESMLDERYLSFRKKLLSVISRLLELGYESFISGMAKGFDTWASEDVLKLGAFLECAIPFPEQAQDWDLPDQQRRSLIISRSNTETIVSEANKKGAYYKRNRYMVDNADVIICGYSGRKSGGTAYTVDYALQQDKIVIQINPITCEVSFLSKRKIDL